ncbi:MAG: DUF5107 domain-containing protein, partial [Verrucomicrobia bacterium]
ELGGRVHRILDRLTGQDLIYHQPVIKPALVGLAGPWISGGIEFNWPQHHRPGTFLPVEWKVERHPDGSVTVWCSDHDPLTRMKGMHGVCLHPDRAMVELKVRAFNRTPFVQTFLWWANVAVRVHEAYQSFFPPDVTHVADHARRSMSTYPLARGVYYGVDYGERARRGVPPDEIPRRYVPPHCGGRAPVDYAPNDLSFYANIPVPTSYMCIDSREDFFGGYDHRAGVGLVHVADHRIAPGKKQWTWGNHEFGYAWDRNLTDPTPDGEYPPYIELMAGVFTDNQPDFSFLQPGETKAWSQFWYPIHRVGPVQQANLDAAVSLRREGRQLVLGVAVTRRFPRARVRLEAAGRSLFQATRTLAPGRPLLERLRLPARLRFTDLVLRVVDARGRELIRYQPRPRPRRPEPAPATEPPPPAKIPSNDELYLTGLHLEQYRHATRSPLPYWEEALRRDPLDWRCHNALGLWHLRRGEFNRAENHFRQAIARLTRRNANPRDGEPFYNLGWALRFQQRNDEARDAFAKACWNQAWVAASSLALAELDCLREDWPSACEHLRLSLRHDADNLRARNLLTLVLRRAGRPEEAETCLQQTLALDPLDVWARHLAGQPLQTDLQALLDVAHDLARAGFFAEAIGLLEKAVFRPGDLPDQSWGALPLVDYTLGWLEQQRGRPAAARRGFRAAARCSPDYCFPARLEEIAILQAAMAVCPEDPRAPWYLGNLLYDRGRREEAIRLWQRSARLDPHFAPVWRNLGIAWFNVRGQPAKARAAYERAFRADPHDARLLYERDQLWKRLGVDPARRLRQLERHMELVCRRDDLSVELCALYNQLGRPADALRLLQSRRFQPWEGGEGGALGQWVRSNLLLGRSAFESADQPGLSPRQRQERLQAALDHFEAALQAPENLGEARHLLANQSDVHHALGCALHALGRRRDARRHWRHAATFQGDFQEMSVRRFSEMTWYSAMAWRRLDQPARAEALLRELLDHARRLEKTPARIDYFATSLPTMLLFDDHLDKRQRLTARFLQAQAWLGLGRRSRARTLLRRVLAEDPAHALAADFLRLTEKAPSWV